MIKRIVSGLFVLTVVATVVDAQESPEVLLRRYLKPGLMPSAAREIPGWPSDREVLLAVASWLPRTMAVDFDMQSQRPYARDGYLELPVRVRTFPQVERWMYYWVVAYVHPVKGIIYSSTYRLTEDRRTGERSFHVGGGSEYIESATPTYLIRGPEAKRLVQEKLGIRVAREPMAVSIFVDNFRNAVGSDHGWFWYVRHEQGFDWAGRKVHSVFVIPLALVNDVRSVTVDELAEDQIAMLALARHRLYTYEGEDIDLYAMDEEQRKNGFRPMSFRKGDPVYLPERLSLVPLLLGTAASEAR